MDNDGTDPVENSTGSRAKRRSGFVVLEEEDGQVQEVMHFTPKIPVYRGSIGYFPEPGKPLSLDLRVVETRGTLENLSFCIQVGGETLPNTMRRGPEAQWTQLAIKNPSNFSLVVMVADERQSEVTIGHVDLTGWPLQKQSEKWCLMGSSGNELLLRLGPSEVEPNEARGSSEASDQQLYHPKGKALPAAVDADADADADTGRVRTEVKVSPRVHHAKNKSETSVWATGTPARKPSSNPGTLKRHQLSKSSGALVLGRRMTGGDQRRPRVDFSPRSGSPREQEAFPGVPVKQCNAQQVSIGAPYNFSHVGGSSDVSAASLLQMGADPERLAVGSPKGFLFSQGHEMERRVRIQADTRKRSGSAPDQERHQVAPHLLRTNRSSSIGAKPEVLERKKGSEGNSPRAQGTGTPKVKRAKPINAHKKLVSKLLKRDSKVPPPAEAAGDARPPSARHLAEEEQEDLVKLRQLGAGGSGSRVYLARLRGFRVCLKEIARPSEQLAAELMNEVRVLQALPPHEHLIRLLGFRSTARAFRIYTTVYDGCLKGLIGAAREPLSDSTVVNYVCQVARGLQALHQCHILHGDIKSENIFYEQHNERVVLVLGDFGEAKVMRGDTTGTIRGTPVFTAPEVMARRDYGLQADVWSLGMVFYELMTLKEPYHELPGWDYVAAIEQGVRPTLSEDLLARYSESTVSLWKRTLELEAASRPTPAELVWLLRLWSAERKTEAHQHHESDSEDLQWDSSSTSE